MDSIWKSKVSSDDNFLLDFNLPWRFTIFIQPTGKQKSLSSLRREIFPEKTQMDTYNPSTRGWCLSPAGLHEWRLSAGYLQHKCSQIKLQKATIFTTYFSYTKKDLWTAAFETDGRLLQGTHSLHWVTCVLTPMWTSGTAELAPVWSTASEGAIHTLL